MMQTKMLRNDPTMPKGEFLLRGKVSYNVVFAAISRHDRAIYIFRSGKVIKLFFYFFYLFIFFCFCSYCCCYGTGTAALAVLSPSPSSSSFSPACMCMCVISLFFFFYILQSDMPRRVIQLKDISNAEIAVDCAENPVLTFIVENRTVRLRFDSWDDAQMWLDMLTNPTASLTLSSSLRANRQAMMHQRKSAMEALRNEQTAGPPSPASDNSSPSTTLRRTAAPPSPVLSPASESAPNREEMRQALKIKFSKIGAGASAGTENTTDKIVTFHPPSSPTTSSAWARRRSIDRLRTRVMHGDGNKVLSLQEVLDTPQYLAALTSYMTKQLCQENILFLKAALAYRGLFDPETRAAMDLSTKQCDPRRTADAKLQRMDTEPRVLDASTYSDSTSLAASRYDTLAIPSQADAVVAVHRQRIANMAKSIQAQFVSRDADHMINLDATSRNDINSEIEANEFTPTLFDAAVSVIYTMVERDVFRRFVESDACKAMLSDSKSLEDQSLRGKHRKTKSFSPYVLVESHSNLSGIATKFAEQSTKIKSRRYRLRKYNKCFKGTQLVDWLLETGYASNRAEAVSIGQRMLDVGVLKHVTDEHDFEDVTTLFYTLEDSMQKTGPSYVEVAADPDALVLTSLLKGVHYHSALVVLAPSSKYVRVYRDKNAKSPLHALRTKHTRCSIACKEMKHSNSSDASDMNGGDLISYIQLDCSKPVRVAVFRVEGFKERQKWIESLAVASIPAEIVEVMDDATNDDLIAESLDWHSLPTMLRGGPQSTLTLGVTQNE
jgi:Domain found in Dishevelled, Egl-10, and Pleckstrin (DEP)/Regulator of G protein signaling domain